MGMSPEDRARYYHPSTLVPDSAPYYVSRWIVGRHGFYNRKTYRAWGRGNIVQEWYCARQSYERRERRNRKQVFDDGPTP